MNVEICHSINLQPGDKLRVHNFTVFTQNVKTKIPTKSLNTMVGHPVRSCESQQTDRSAQRVTNSVSSTWRNPGEN